MFEIIVEKEGLELLGFREVPVHPEVLGEKARSCMPHIVQAFIKSRSMWRKDWSSRGSFILPAGCLSRVMTTPMWYPCPAERSYTNECFLVGQLRTFFADLQDPDYESAIALVHSRFSTNTNPSWERAASESVLW